MFFLSIFPIAYKCPKFDSNQRTLDYKSSTLTAWLLKQSVIFLGITYYTIVIVALCICLYTLINMHDQFDKTTKMIHFNIDVKK